MTSQNFHLTRQAARVLCDIHKHSLKQWGQKTADAYLADLYAAMKQAAAKPATGQLRAHRAVPFLMVPAREHFIVYDRLEKDIVILTLLHQRRDIERVINELEPSFLTEIERLREGKT
jgi:plasmid stabilization system protein ParE